MKTLKGFGIIEGIGAIVALAFLIGAITLLAHTIITSYENTRREGHDAGVAETDAAYTKRDNDKLVKAAARIKQLEEVARAEESRTQAAVNVAVAKHIKEKANAQSKLADIQSRIASGALILRDPGIRTGTGCPGGGGRTGTEAAGDPAGSAGRDGGGELRGQGSGVLSDEARAFILSEAARADRKVMALQLCRAALLGERPLTEAPLALKYSLALNQ